MTFTVDSPWIADTRADVWSVSDSVKGAMSIVPFVGKFLGTSCSATKSTTVPQSATSLMKALRASSDLTVGKVAKTTLAGHDAVQVDLTANAHPTCPTDPQIYLWVLPTSGEFHLDENESARVIASDIGNRTFVVVIESVPGMDQAGLITETGTILDTLTIH
jgi:hypothetical protein